MDSIIHATGADMSDFQAFLSQPFVQDLGMRNGFVKVVPPSNNLLSEFDAENYSFGRNYEFNMQELVPTSSGGVQLFSKGGRRISWPQIRQKHGSRVVDEDDLVNFVNS